MGKGSKQAKMPKDDAFDAALKQQGPGMSDPVGPLLQLTTMGGFPGQIDWNATSLGSQMAALPPEVLEQIRMASMPRPVPTAPSQPLPAPKSKIGLRGRA